MTAFSMMAATTLTWPLQNRHSVMSTLKTLFRSFAQDIRELDFSFFSAVAFSDFALVFCKTIV